MTREEQFDSLLIDEAALHVLMRDHMDWVTKCLGDGQHTSWAPMVAALVKDGPDDKGAMWMHALHIDFNEHEEKHRTMHALGRRIYEEKKIPVAVVMSSECWISEQRPGTKAKHCEPRHDPARREAIQVSGLALGKNEYGGMTSAPITRYKNNHIRVGRFLPLMKAERLALLERFFLGFFEKTAEMAGIQLPECP